jgi:heterodisulfide reductase subunit B
MTRPKHLTTIERSRRSAVVMEEMLDKIGAETIDWAYKVECCGAGLSVSRTDIGCEIICQNNRRCRKPRSRNDCRCMPYVPIQT